MEVLILSSLTLTQVFLLASQAASQELELNSTLHLTVYDAPIAYTNEMVTFTCVVRGSNSMAWTSEEYIGTGGQRLELSAAEPVGQTQTAVGNAQTVAELINATLDVIIISQLSIRVQSNYQTASVQCHNINAGINTSIEFILADTTFINCDKQTVCSGETVTCTCTIGNSNTLAWTSNGDRLMFTSTDPMEMRRNVTGSSTFAVLTENSNVNGIRVITSNLTFVTSSTSSKSNVLTCSNDRSISESMIIPVSEFSIMMLNESCTDPLVTTRVPASNGITSESTMAASLDSCATPTIAAIVVPVIIFIVVVITVIVLIVICMRQYTRIKRLNMEKDELNNNVRTKQQQIEGLKTENQNLDDRLKSTKNELQQSQRNLRSKEEELNRVLQLQREANRKITSLESDLERAKAAAARSRSGSKRNN